MATSLGELVLVHVVSRERITVPILYIADKPKIEVQWPLAGRYSFDIGRNRLFTSARSMAPLLWEAEDASLAFKIWHRNRYPAKHLKECDVCTIGLESESKESA